MIPVLISGGSGTRLWPVSRNKWPKQFCNLFEESLQSLSLRRVAKLGSPLILTSHTLKDLTEKKLKEVHISAKPLYEPQAKNTAPAIAFLCRYLAMNGLENEVVGIFPSDHLIEKEDEFIHAVSLAVKEAQQGFIVTLGIQPHYPATGFGYIKTEKDVSLSESGIESFKVSQFIEKPSVEKAKALIQSQTCYWNAGIFIFQVQNMIRFFKKKAPDIWAPLENLKQDLSNVNQVYDQFRNVSIDYAVLEKLSKDELRCVPCDIGWNDIGSWDAISEIQGLEKKNQSRVDYNSKNNFLHSQKDKSYAFIGVDDLIVVDTKDALLIAKKGQSQDVRIVVEKMKLISPEVTVNHIDEDRPWGGFEVLKNTEDYKTKVVHVLPQSQISYQSHNKREEHWLVAQGQGEVVLDEKIIPIKKGSYIKIPQGAKHRIRNTGKEMMEFVELQLGTYFGEDDIIRYQDDYQRN